MPAYYRTMRVDVWFRLLDIRRIAGDDTLAVIEEPRRLRNVHDHDRPVSLYGGMTNLPLVLTRDEEAGSWTWATSPPTSRSARSASSSSGTP